MGSTSWEAYSVGFVLVGSVVFCAGFGWWLDSRLGTSYWLPICFLIGVGAGFREMFRTVQRIQQEQAAKIAKQEAERSSAPLPVRKETPEASTTVGRERNFQVPPPPFLDGKEAQSSANGGQSQRLGKFLEELLQEGEEKPPADGSNK